MDEDRGTPELVGRADRGTPELVVRAERLRAARGVTVARGVELSAGAGDVVAVEGANGSGKSTLLAAAAGLLPSGPGSRRPASVGYAPERADTMTRMPLRRWLTGLGRTAGLSRAQSGQQADDLIVRLGLGGVTGRPLRALSRGNMQRALVAQALLGPPALVVLDEPAGGLDADGLARLAGEIERAARQSVVLVARHPTAPVPLPAGPAWRIGEGRVTVHDRRSNATALMEVETGDGRVQRVVKAELPGVLRTALDAGLEVSRVQPVRTDEAKGAVGADRAGGMDEGARAVGGAGPRSAAGAGARAAGGAGVRRAGGGRRLLYGAAHRASLLVSSQWFAAPALIFLALLAAIYSVNSVPPPPPLSSPAFTAIALAMVATWLTVLAHTVDGRVVARAFGAHVGGPGRAHLAACLATVPFVVVATVAAVVWPWVTGWPGDWTSPGFVAEVAGLQLAAAVFGIGVGALLVPPLVVATGWRVCLSVALYLAFVLIPDSPMRPMLRLSVGNGVSGPALAAWLLAGVGAALIAVTTVLARRLL